MDNLTDGSRDSQVQVLFRSGPAGELTDDRLVERFLAGDSIAFEVLIRRHGPMVCQSCRAILRDRHEAEDAFQATFLVLARRAESIRRRDSLAPWLRGVARRVAVRLKRKSDRRRELDRGVAPDASTDPELGCGRSEVIAAVREEVGRLPARARLPVMLCDLEGMSYEEAAETLGLSPDALRGRLARARARLRARLAARGLDPVAALPPLILASRPPGIGAGLIKATIQSAMQLAAGRAIVAGSATASVATLSEEIIQAMRYPFLKPACILILPAVLATAGAFVRAKGDPQAPPMPAGEARKPAAVPDLERLQGTWLRIAMESGGICRLLPEDPQGRLRISGSDFSFGAAVSSPEIVRLDPTLTPKTLDLTPTADEAGPTKGVTYLGIYELESDTLMLCLDPDGKRPQQFATKPNSRVVIDIYRRTGR